MGAIWTLKHDGVEKTLADWGIENPRARIVTHHPSVLRFQMPLDADADPPFGFEDTVEIYQQPDPDNPATKFRWFVGVVVEPERALEDGEMLSFEAVDPFYWLENRTMQQTWKSYDNGLGQLVTLTKSRLFLGLDVDGNKLNTKQVLMEALDWAISNGAPLQYDATGFPEVNIPVIPANQVSVAEVVRMVLQVTPDAVTWFDYTTNPPTLKIKRAASLPPVSLAWTDAPARATQIRARRDLQRAAVVINYEVTSSVNGNSFVQTVVDKWPLAATGFEHKAVVFTINLQGAQATYQFTDLEVQPVNAAHANTAIRNAWWREKAPWLAASDIQSFTVSNVVRQSNRPSEPVSGVPAPWMRDDQGNPLSTGVETITALVAFTYKDGRKGQKLIPVRVTTTTGQTKVYSTLTSLVFGEPLPTGLAKEHFDAVNRLHYQGRHTLEAEDVSGAASIGNLLNLSGGRAEWATMNAIIWEVDHDLEAGRTVLSFGPAENLAPTDLVANLELWRSRFTWTNALAMTAGQSGALSQVETTEGPAKENTSAGVDKHERVIMELEAQPFAGGGPQLDLNMADALSAGSKVIKLREVDECVEVSPGNFETWKRLVLCSDKWKP